MQLQVEDSTRPFAQPKTPQISQPPIVSKIRQLYESQDVCNDFLERIKGGLQPPQIIEQLENYLGKAKAQALGEEVFKQLGGTAKTQIQLLFQYLQKHYTPEDINKIKTAIESKKKKKIKRALNQIFGNAIASKRFSLIEKEIEEQKKQPLGYEKIKRKGEIGIYHYVADLTSQQIGSAKNVMIFGETGCGKSTFLNAVINRFMGVDPEDKFRYQIVIEKDDEVKFSLTKNVTQYFVRNKENNRVYRLIDTPGFGDTQGYERDEVTLGLIKQKLNSLKQIHMIIFVLKSTITRLNIHQKYVLHSLMNLFTKFYIKNIMFLLTFADTGKSVAHTIISDKKEGFGNYSDNFLTIETNNSCIFQQIDETDNMKFLYWDQAMAAIDKIFIQVDRINPKSMQQNKEYFSMMYKCQMELNKYHQAIDKSMVHQNKILQHISQLLRLHDKIDQNEDHSKLKIRIAYKEVRHNYPTLRCINCRNTNCHISCYDWYGTIHFADPHYCQVMNRAGNCTVCPGRCHHSLHRKTPFSVERGIQSYTEIDQQMKNRWRSFRSQHDKLINVYTDTICQLENQFQEAKKSIEKIYPIMTEISKRRLNSNFEEVTIEYLNYLCNNLKKDQTPQSQQKIKALNSKIIKLDEKTRYLEYPLKILRPFLELAESHYKKHPKVIRLVTDKLKSLIRIFQGINQQPEKTLLPKVQPPSLPASPPPPPPPKKKQSPSKNNSFNQTFDNLIDYSPAKKTSYDSGANQRCCPCCSCCNGCWNCVFKNIFCCCN